MVIRSQTGDPRGNPPSQKWSVGNSVPRYGVQSVNKFPAIVTLLHFEVFTFLRFPGSWIAVVEAKTVTFG